MTKIDEQQNGIQAFWMVHGINAGAPNVRHPTKAHAECEARRLSMAHRGTTFVVLEAVDAFQMPPEQPYRLEVWHELPF